MAGFSYDVPDAAAFMHTLRRYLEATGEAEIAALLINASCDIGTSSSYSRIRWDAFAASVTFVIPVTRLPKTTDDVRQKLFSAVKAVFPKDAGYDIIELEISPFLEVPPDEEMGPLNTAAAISGRLIEHDELKFRSQSEVRIYEALKKRKVLFFANATAVLGGKNTKREPDFLVCQDGKWGILEVMGESYHPSATAMRDHDRARLFKDYGLFIIEFYDAAKCYNTSEAVVADFLARLAKA
jgi:hypothetical protein